jgi:tight adherence protein C
MGNLIQQLSTGELAYLPVLFVAFVAVVALFFGVRYLLSTRTNVVRDRLQRTVGATSGTFGEVDATPGARPGDSFWHKALFSFSRLSRPTSEEDMGRLRRRLSQAGYRGELAMITYLSAKLFLCLAAGGLILWWNASREEPLRFVPLYTILAMTVGFYIPSIWLYLRITRRQREINHALPDALDLIVTCVEAGLGLDASMERVSREVALSSPLLAAELGQASLEMRAGMPRGEAFRRLADRTGVEELQYLAAIIIQTDIFGTSVAKSLRVQADAMRIRRTQIAEERAATVAVKMTVPLVFCILPALFAVLMGPAVVKIYRILMPTLSGGG